MAYAGIEDIRVRLTRELDEKEAKMANAFLEDAAALIDAYNKEASEDVKRTVSCRMVLRILGDGQEISVPVGASQGSMSGLGYSQSWTFGSGASGELYLSKTDKKLLGAGSLIGSKSPLEDLTGGTR